MLVRVRTLHELSSAHRCSGGCGYVLCMLSLRRMKMMRVRLRLLSLLLLLLLLLLHGHGRSVGEHGRHHDHLSRHEHPVDGEWHGRAGVARMLVVQLLLQQVGGGNCSSIVVLESGRMK